jgi:hypothetical protein
MALRSPMAVSPKVPQLPLVLDDIALPSLQLVPKVPQLDFAANPNRYRAKRQAGKPKTRQYARGVDLSPRLTLELSVECESKNTL